MHRACDLVARSEELVLRGRAADAVDLLSAGPSQSRDRAVWLALGDAYRAEHKLDAALAAYEQAVPGGISREPLEAAIAWRVGLVHHARGEPGRALETYRRASTSGGEGVDEAWLFTAAATAHWLLGDADQALGRARDAVQVAAATGESRVRAAAHVAMALVVSLGGDPATVEEEYALAAGFADEAGDLVQLARIGVNRSHHLLADARFTEAVDAAVAGGLAAEELGSATLLAVALGNEAEGLVRLGRCDEAQQRCERALALAGAIGTPRTAGALVVMAEVHLRQGCREQGRAALEQALRLTTDRQVRVPALASLAVALLPEEVDLAAATAAEALAEARGSGVLPALLAAGRTAWTQGDAGSARALTARAVEHARQRRERCWLAEALELRAATVAGVQARDALREAYQIWRNAGAGHDADRVLVHLARITPVSSSDRLAGRAALARLARADVLDTARFVPGSRFRIRIHTFGRFTAYVDGVQVAADAWQSRQARELLRLLTCRRGRAIPRLEICELLWPDDDPAKTMHRLSVVLSIVRGVLGPEAILADQACVALNSAQVRVDVEQLLTDVADAVHLHDQGEIADARTLLIEAVQSYTDEPFADAPYDDQADALREEGRAAYHHALRLLARLCRDAGEYDQAAGYLRRLLGDDRYDEDAHRSLLAVLVRARRHGQARRAAARYRAAMADLGVHAGGSGLQAAG
jgi:DNA-binding SARP family transcriptional activator